MNPSSPALLMVTGPPGAGKTTRCLRCVAWARARGYAVGGVLSPTRRSTAGVTKGLQAVASGQEHLLAWPAAAHETPTVGIWRFDPATLAWGQAVLRGLGAVDLLVIDEIGPLELLHQQGLTAAFEVLSRRAYRVALLSVRPTLVGLLLERLQALGLTGSVGPPPTDEAAWQRALAASLKASPPLPRRDP